MIAITHSSPVAHPRLLAIGALARYALSRPRVTLLGRRFNLLFRVETEEGRFLLRLHRREERRDLGLDDHCRWIGSEMLWLRDLTRETSLVAPTPVAARDGALVTIAAAGDAALPCTLLRWVEGRFQDRGLRPVHLERVGEMTARLHDHAATFVPPAGFERGNSDGLDGPDGMAQFAPLRSDAAMAAAWVGREFAEGYSREAGRLVERGIERIWGMLAGLGDGREVFGLVHSDIHQGNYLFAGGGARLIDFNRCGYAHYLYDLACTLVNLHGRPDHDALRAALLRGYRRVRPLPIEHERYLAPLIALRGGLEHAHWPLTQRGNPLFGAGWRDEVEKGLAHLVRFLEADDGR